MSDWQTEWARSQGPGHRNAWPTPSVEARKKNESAPVKVSDETFRKTGISAADIKAWQATLNREIRPTPPDQIIMQRAKRVALVLAIAIVALPFWAVLNLGTWLGVLGGTVRSLPVQAAIAGCARDGWSFGLTHLCEATVELSAEIRVGDHVIQTGGPSIHATVRSPRPISGTVLVTKRCGPRRGCSYWPADHPTPPAWLAFAWIFGTAMATAAAIMLLRSFLTTRLPSWIDDL